VQFYNPLGDPSGVDFGSISADPVPAVMSGSTSSGPGPDCAFARTDSDLETAFATLSQQRVGAVLVGAGSFFDTHVELLTALAARHALPAIFALREFALAGGLMSYGSSSGYGYQQVGIYTGPALPDVPQVVNVRVRGHTENHEETRPKKLRKFRASRTPIGTYDN
jgi:hypothetical protein